MTYGIGSSSRGRALGPIILRLLGGLSIATTLFGCGAEKDSGAQSSESPILNGTIVQPWPSGTPAYTRAIMSVPGCTGTLVDPEWVLSAKHCSFQVGQAVTNIRPSGNVTRTIDRVVGHPTSREDGALLHLSAPINDVPIVPIYWGTTEAIIGNSVTCYGYGANQAGASCTTNADCPSGWFCKGVCQVSSGDLRKATMSTTTEPDQVTNPGTFDVLRNGSNQTLLAGDSGGPCFFNDQLAAINSAFFFDLSHGIVTGMADFRAWMIATMRGQRTRLFQGVENNVVYFLDASNNLWRENGNNSSKAFVDGSVRSFHAINASAVYVLGLDGNLWNEQPDSSHRTQVDAGVRAFQGIDTTNVIVLGNDGNLWREIGNFTNRVQVDGNVLNFRSVGAAGSSQHIYVLGNDRVLWNETGTAANRTQVDSNVVDFKPVDNSRVYVLGTDFKLWNELGNNSNRTQVDASVEDMQGMDSSLVYVLGQDRNLWRERGSFSNRDLVDGGVLRYQAMDATIVYVMGLDGNLWREIGNFNTRTFVDRR